MRRSVAIAVIAGVCAIAADASAQSRYGPAATPSPMAADAAADLPPGALLGWRGKPAPRASAAPEAPGPTRPEPVAAWSQKIAALAPPAPRALPEPASVIQAEPPAPTPAPLPTSLYDAPRPAPAMIAPAPSPRPAAPAAPLRPAPAVAAPTALLGAPPAVRPAPADPSAPAGPRFYSVYREYGVAPDAIPVAPAPVRNAEVQLKEVPQTPSLATPDDTQYVPVRTNQSGAAANRTF